MDKVVLEKNIEQAQRIMPQIDSYARISQDRLKRSLKMALELEQQQKVPANLLTSVNILLKSAMSKTNLVKKKRTFHKSFSVGKLFTDTEGAPIQAHGGGFLKQKDAKGNVIYYWVGEDKSHNQGNFNGITLYSSKDLLNWQYRKTILGPSIKEPGLLNCKIERPKIIYNQQNHQYLVWGHWEDDSGYASSQICVAACDRVDGEYRFLGHWRPGADQEHRNWRLLRTDPQDFSKGKFIWDDHSGATEKFDFLADAQKWGIMSRDFTLYQDGEKVYLISSAGEEMNVFQLNDNMTNVKKNSNYTLFDNYREAPAVIKAGKYYFLITSYQTGWHPNQSSYSYTTNLADPQSWIKPTKKNPHYLGNSTTFFSQSTNVLQIGSKNKPEYLYMGDRWYPSRLGSSSYVWLPLLIRDNKMTLNYCSNWSLDTASKSIRKDKVKLLSQQKKFRCNPPVDNVKVLNDGQYFIDSPCLLAQGKVMKPPYNCTVDLEKESQIARVDITFAYNRHGKTVPDFTLAISSDGQNWRIVGQMTDSNEVGFVSQNINAQGRFLRLRLIKAISTQVNSLVEVQVYGKD